jgi:hypothetical protein
VGGRRGDRQTIRASIEDGNADNDSILEEIETYG